MSDWQNSVSTGDAFDVMADLPSDSVHACVTDPPYGLAFMGRDWDDFEPREYQTWCEEWATLALDVLRPGGHLLAFSGNRTHHRLFTGVEDAGFEIRDTVTYHFGSGFPKAADISKTIDKRGGRVVKGVGPVIKDAREEKGLSTRELAEYFADEGQDPTGCVWNWENGASNPTVENFNKLVDVLELPFEPIEPAEQEIIATSDKPEGWFTQGDGYDITEPATDTAKKWDGWKTGLKPATEFVVLARKPFEGATVDCVLEHETGALNIDGCRIDTGEDIPEVKRGGFENSYEASKSDLGEGDVYTPSEAGRYPANVIFDAEAAAQLDREVGETTEHNGQSFDGQTVAATQDTYGDYDGERTVHSFNDSGGPSRYFYTSKATRAERTLDGKIDNAHPTVKPVDLMEWLVRLVTREGQTVLDPFAGTGTTLKAAKDLGREFVGVEQDPQWADVARARVGLDVRDPSRVRDADAQQGLEAFADGGIE